MSRNVLVLLSVVGPCLVGSIDAWAEGAGAGPLRPVTGTIEVPADHAHPRSAPALKLYFERLGGPGKKPAIVLHGGPAAAAPMTQILQGSEPGRAMIKHYDLLYFHQRGSGRSLLPEEAKLDFVVAHKDRYVVDQYVEDIEIIRQKVFGKGAKVTLIGSSWGGFLGLAYTAKHQDRVEAMILGSFEATSTECGARFCENGDRALISAAADVPELGEALLAFRRAVAAGKVVWRRNKKDHRTLGRTDILEVALPLIMKARHRQLAELLQGLAKGDSQAQAVLDRFDLREMASAGGSLPGTATYCQELVNKRQLEAAVAAPPEALYADCGKIYRFFSKLCSPFLTGSHPFDLESALPRLKVPAVIFAGRSDPWLPWQATARTAAKMKNATFLLIKGGHTPVDEGGACLTKVIENLASRRYKYDLSCF